AEACPIPLVRSQQRAEDVPLPIAETIETFEVVAADVEPFVKERGRGLPLGEDPSNAARPPREVGLESGPVRQIGHRSPEQRASQKQAESHRSPAMDRCRQARYGPPIRSSPESQHPIDIAEPDEPTPAILHAAYAEGDEEHLRGQGSDGPALERDRLEEGPEALRSEPEREARREQPPMEVEVDEAVAAHPLVLVPGLDVGPLVPRAPGFHVAAISQ